jgi:hypothetical protein
MFLVVFPSDIKYSCSSVPMEGWFQCPPETPRSADANSSHKMAMYLHRLKIVISRILTISNTMYALCR